VDSKRLSDPPIVPPAIARSRRSAVPVCGAVVVIGLLATGCTRVDTSPTVGTYRPAVRDRAAVRRAPRRDVPRSAITPVRTIELGRSVCGDPLTLQLFGSGPDCVFIFGGIHGSEPTSAALARELAHHLPNHPELLAGRTVAILTDANPDGLRQLQRANANGVDLNRNFPAQNWQRSSRTGQRHGSIPASEPETRAIIRVVEVLRPSRIVSIHSIARGRHCNNFDGPAKHLAEAMSRCNGYPVRAVMGYPTPGSFGSWAGIDRGIPTITLELPRDLDAAACWRENARALLAFIAADGTRPGR
jgi:protein MpaA